MTDVDPPDDGPDTAAVEPATHRSSTDPIATGADADPPDLDREGPDVDDHEAGDRITEIGHAETVDTAEHPVAAVVGGVLLVVVILLGLFGLGRIFADASEGREVPVVVVPRLSGRPVAQAEADLERLGLIVDIQYQANEVVAVDVVVEQTPIAGARLEVGERVVLGVSDGPSGVRVPETAGQPIADATRLLSVVGLTVVPVEVHDEQVVAGLVMSTSPSAGSRSMVGASVEVVVSIGPEPRVVPEVVGLPSTEAMAAIGRSELNVGEVTRRPVAGVEPGRLASISPAAGAAVPRGSRVDVVIATEGTGETVPDLVGLRRASAEEVADSLGISLSVTTEAVTATDRRIGLVISQTPVADSPLASMSVVIAVVPPPPTTTTTTIAGATTTTTTAAG